MKSRLAGLFCLGLLLVAVACGGEDEASAIAVTTTCPSDVFPAVGAVDAASGDVLWVTCTPTESFRSVMGATDEFVIVMESGADGTWAVFALDATDGAELWRWDAADARRPSGPVAGAGVVVFPTGTPEAPELVGVDARSGAERWRVPGPLAVLGSNEQVVAVERVSDLAGSEPVRGLDRTTGAELWVSEVRQLDRSGVMGGTQPTAVWQDTLIVPTGQTATAIDLTTGAVAWTSADAGTPYGADDVVIGAGPVQGPGATVTAVDVTSGASLWSGPGRLSYGQYVALGDGIVVAVSATGAGSIAYEQDSGAERWQVDSGTQPYAVVDGRVFSLWEQQLDARSADDGTVLWEQTEPFGSPWMRDLAATSSAVFVAVNSLPFGD
jgi:outer membrane protein assembly factor BamB